MHRLLKRLLFSISLVTLFPCGGNAQTIGAANEQFARIWHVQELVLSSIDYTVESKIIGTFANELGSDYYKNKLSAEERLNAWNELKNISSGAVKSARAQLNQNGTNAVVVFFSHGRCEWVASPHETSSDYREWASNVVKEIISGHRLAKHLFAVGPLNGYQSLEMLEAKSEDKEMLNAQYGLGQQFPMARSLLVALPNKPQLSKYAMVDGDDISSLKRLSLENIATAKAKRFMAPRCLEEGISRSEMYLRSEPLKSFWSGTEMANAISKVQQLKGRLLKSQ